jgi:hypothetical protein
VPEPRPRTKRKSTFTIYDDQFAWLRRIRYEQEADMSTIVRFALDTLMHVRPDDLAILLREQQEREGP